MGIATPNGSRPTFSSISAALTSTPPSNENPNAKVGRTFFMKRGRGHGQTADVPRADDTAALSATGPTGNPMPTGLIHCGTFPVRSDVRARTGSAGNTRGSRRPPCRPPNPAGPPPSPRTSACSHSSWSEQRQVQLRGPRQERPNDGFRFHVSPNPDSEADLTEANQVNEEGRGCSVSERNGSDSAARPSTPSPFVFLRPRPAGAGRRR
jgi:hypothetical protein